MPDISLNSVSAVTAARGQQNNPGTQPDALSAAQEGGREQPSFAQVLREQRPPEQKPAGKPETGASAESRTDEAAPEETAAEAPASGPVSDPAAQPVVLATMLAMATSTTTTPPVSEPAVEGGEAGKPGAAPLIASVPVLTTAGQGEGDAAATATAPADTSAASPASLAAAADGTATGEDGAPASSPQGQAPALAGAAAEPRGAVPAQATTPVDAQAKPVAQDAAPALTEVMQSDGAARNEQLNATYALGQAAAPVEAPPRHTVATPVMQRGWAEEVGQRLVWVANQDNGIAELVLTPPQLGRIEVSIQMAGDQASAQFVSASPIAREALQDALPRLRELLANAGIQLGEASVSAGQGGQGQGAHAEGRHGSGLAGIAAHGMDLPSGAHALPARQGVGLIDTFA